MLITVMFTWTAVQIWRLSGFAEAQTAAFAACDVKVDPQQW